MMSKPKASKNFSRFILTRFAHGNRKVENHGIGHQ